MEMQELVGSQFGIPKVGLPGMIVVVEDPFIRTYLRAALARKGYRVVGTDARTAAEMIRSGADAVDLLITNSPGDFVEFADSTPVLYLSGAPDPDQVAPFSASRVLQKPFHPEDLFAAVRELTACPV